MYVLVSFVIRARVPDNRIPACDSTQLQCIAKHNSELRFYSPPIGNIRGFLLTEMKSPLNCSQCLPTCHESVYDLDVDYSLDSLPLARNSYGSVDIFYRNEGAVKYERDVTFGWIDLLGACATGAERVEGAPFCKRAEA